MYSGRVNSQRSGLAEWERPIARGDAAKNRVAMLADFDKRFSPPVPFESDATEELSGIDPALHTLFSEQPIHQSSEPTAPHEIRKVLTDGTPSHAEDADDFLAKAAQAGRLRVAQGVEADEPSGIEVIMADQLAKILDSEKIGAHRATVLPTRDGSALSKSELQSRTNKLFEEIREWCEPDEINKIEMGIKCHDYTLCMQLIEGVLSRVKAQEAA